MSIWYSQAAVVKRFFLILLPALFVFVPTVRASTLPPGCYDGGVIRPVGYTTTCRTDEEGENVCIADAVFYCGEDTRWHITGGFQPPPVCTQEYEPVCGALYEQVYCITEPCPQLKREKTFANLCLLEEAGAVFLHDGACEINPTPPPAVTNHAPIIRFFTGAVNAIRGDTVAWTARVFDQDNDDALVALIDWGDGTQDVRNVTAGTEHSLFFSHSFAYAGTYTVILTVSDSMGASASTVRTIQVTNPEPVQYDNYVYPWYMWWYYPYSYQWTDDTNNWWDNWYSWGW